MENVFSAQDEQDEEDEADYREEEFLYSSCSSCDDHHDNPRPRRRTRRPNPVRRRRSQSDQYIQNYLNRNVDLFEATRSKCKNPSANICSRNVSVKSLKKILESDRPSVPGDDEEEIEVTSVDDRVPIDPFTNKEIENPVRNIKCNHVYDRDGIAALLSIRKNPR